MVDEILESRDSEDDFTKEKGEQELFLEDLLEMWKNDTRELLSNKIKLNSTNGATKSCATEVFEACPPKEHIEESLDEEEPKKRKINVDQDYQ